MIRLNNENNSFLFEILGYSYPFSNEEWDSNWLQVKINIKDYNNSIDFENSDTCLLTMELVQLKEWLYNIGKDSESSSKITFMEPNIAFKYKNEIVSIILKYDFNPFINYDETPKEKLGEPYIINFNKQEFNPLTVIQKIDDYIKKYPQKGNPR